MKDHALLGWVRIEGADGNSVGATNPLPVALSGSNGEQDIRGLAAARPAADSVIIGSTYWSVDTGVVEVSDGTAWRRV